MRQLRLVLVQDVLVDRRHDVVRELHAAPEGLRLLGQIVVRQDHVGLIPLVVVQHRRDRLRHVRAVLLDRQAVEGAGERGDDRVDGHAIGEGPAIGGDHPIAVRELRATVLDLPDPAGLHVLRRQLGLVLHELRDRVADPAIVGSPEALDDLFHLIPGDREGHLVVLRLAEDAVARARQDHLRLVRPHRRHDDLRAVDAAPERRGDLAAPLPERRLRQAHDLGGVGVDADQVRLEGGAIERRHQERRILARGEFVDRGLRALARRLRLGVHALAERPGVVQVGRLLEAERRDAERADVVLARERDHPAVAPGHVDDLAVHAELLEITRRAPGFLGNRLVRPEHADRYRERLRADVELQFPIGRLDVDHERRLPVQRTTLFRRASADGAPAPRQPVARPLEFVGAPRLAGPQPRDSL